MFYFKRLYSALFMGFICGILCFIFGKYLFSLPFGVSNFGFIILNRTIMGFVIAISCIKIHWLKHGALIGFIVGSVFAYSDAMAGFPWFIVLLVVFVNMVFGIIIEYFTTFIFKSPMKDNIKTFT